MHAHDFQRWGPFWGMRVGVNGRLKPFRKFIRFGTLTRPNVLWLLENNLLYQFHAQKALFKVPKICNKKFWIENDPPPFTTFPKIHTIWYPSLSGNLRCWNSTRQDIVSEIKKKGLALPVFRVDVVIIDLKWSSESQTISMPIGPHEWGKWMFD